MMPEAAHLMLAAANHLPMLAATATVSKASAAPDQSWLHVLCSDNGTIHCITLTSWPVQNAVQLLKYTGQALKEIAEAESGGKHKRIVCPACSSTLPNLLAPAWCVSDFCTEAL